MGAGYRRKTDRQTVEIRSGAVERFDIPFYRVEQLGHRPVKALLEPRAGERRSRHASRRVENELLRGQIHTTSTYRPLAADQIRAIFLTLHSIPIKKN